MPSNQIRKQLLDRIKTSTFPGSIIDVFRAADQGVDLISQHEQQEQMQQQQQQQDMQVANTPEQQEVGLREQHAMGNTGASMAFPDVQPNQSFNTVGMKAPIDIQKINKQGHLVESYKNVPPGIQDLPTGPYEGTIIESPAAYQTGGAKKRKDEYLIQGQANTLGLKNHSEISKWYVKHMDKINFGYKDLDDFLKDWPYAIQTTEWMWLTNEGGPEYDERVRYKKPRPKPIKGCTDPDARNYNPKAEIDDGSCRGKEMKPIEISPIQPLPVAEFKDEPLLPTREYRPPGEPRAKKINWPWSNRASDPSISTPNLVRGGKNRTSGLYGHNRGQRRVFSKDNPLDFINPFVIGKRGADQSGRRGRFLGLFQKGGTKKEIGDTIIYPPGDEQYRFKPYNKEILDIRNKLDNTNIENEYLQKSYQWEKDEEEWQKKLYKNRDQEVKTGGVKKLYTRKRRLI